MANLDPRFAFEVWDHVAQNLAPSVTPKALSNPETKERVMRFLLAANPGLSKLYATFKPAQDALIREDLRRGRTAGFLRGQA